jgi:hypothetical protein
MARATATDKSARALFLVAALSLVALASALACGLPIGIPGQWIWRRNELPLNPLVMVAALAAGAAFALLAWMLTRRDWEGMGRARRALWLALLVLVVFAMQTALLNAIGVPWSSPGAIIASPKATTYFGVSLEVKELLPWLAHYQEVMPRLPYHAQTHPPGVVLFFSAVRRATAGVVPAGSPYWSALAKQYEFFGIGPTAADAAAAVVSAFLIAFIGALGLIPIYLLAANLVADRVALYTALLAGTVPTLLLLGASPDLLLFTLTATTMWLAYVAWRLMRPGPALLAGLVFGLGTFLSLGLLVVAGWLALLALVGMLRRSDRRAALRQFIPVAAAGAGGFLALYLALFLALGYHPIAVAREALFAHRGVTTQAARGYLAWLFMNPAEFGIFAGLPLVIAAVWSIVDVRGQEEFRCLRTFLIASVITFAVLDLSGTVRAEVGRIWLFLMWPLAMAAAPMFARRERSAILLGLLLLQVMQALLMRSYLTLYDLL